jgi:hypothetical protein
MEVCLSRIGIAEKRGQGVGTLERENVGTLER